MKPKTHSSNMDLRKIVFAVKVCRKSKKPIEKNIPLSAALSKVAQITDSVMKLLGHCDVDFSFEDFNCEMVIDSTVLQELVDKALTENSSDLLKSHFGDACTRLTAGVHKITLKASPKPAADPPPAKKAKASGESSGDCIALEPVLEVGLLILWSPFVHQRQVFPSL